MVKKYITDDRIISEIHENTKGMWVNMVDPTGAECSQISKEFGIDIADIRASLDEEETSRVESLDNYSMVILDIPTKEIRHEHQAYTTIPLSIIWNEEVVISICSEPTPILEHFIKFGMKGFSTKKQVRFCYQIFMRTCMMYQEYLRIIDRRRIEIEEQLSKKTNEKDIIILHELESTLVYFDTSLRANRVVLDRLARYNGIRRYAEDQDLLEDAIVENQQAIEMTQIYRDIIRGTRDLMSTIIDSRLNNVMKYLAAITIVMAIPTIISGLYGMNVDTTWMPLANTPYGFQIICGITAVICLVLALILKKRKML